MSEKTLLRDVNELIAMEILKEDEDEIHYYANKPNLVYYMIKVGEAKPAMFSVSKIVW